MVLDYPMSRTEAGWYFSWDRLWERWNGRLYFWTVTPPGMNLGDKEFAKRWHHFVVTANRAMGAGVFFGLRVFERFQTGWLHCHFVVGVRLSWYAVQRWCLRAGLGYVVHVRKAVASDRSYLAKYLSKSSGKLAKGVRQWAALGRGWHCRGVDVEIIGQEVEKRRRLASLVGRLGLDPGARFLMFRKLLVLSKELECASVTEKWVMGLPDLGICERKSAYECVEEF